MGQLEVGDVLAATKTSRLLVVERNLFHAFDGVAAGSAESPAVTLDNAANTGFAVTRVGMVPLIHAPH